MGAFQYTMLHLGQGRMIGRYVHNGRSAKILILLLDIDLEFA